MASRLGAMLRTRIKTAGPISVAEYMRTCLTDPESGYYVHGNPIGRSGDFTTAPEISQIFGELVGIWCIYEWQRAGFLPKYPKLRVVELGPGKGTLSCDILRTIVQTVKKSSSALKGDAKANVELHLVEVSKRLANIQRSVLCGTDEHPTDRGQPDLSHPLASKYDSIPVFWHSTVEETIEHLQASAINSPGTFDVFVANEFFDALPVHKFERIGDATKVHDQESAFANWREVLVDCDQQNRFRYVNAPIVTASCVYLSHVNVGSRQHVEVSVESGRIVQLIAKHLGHCVPGACLIIDYGHLGEKQDTLRAFREHRVSAPFEHEPGECDLTADVDFAFLRRHADALRAPLQTFRAIEQREFLVNLGIGYRLQKLLQNTRDSQTRNRLIASVKRIMDEKEMGSRFKAFAITTNGDRKSGPAGFVLPA